VNKTGQAAEQRALEYLTGQGLKLVERNWHCAGGELDLVMRDDTAWVFVEVRHRASAHFGGAAASITPAKCRKLVHAAQVYLTSKGIDAPCRFDAVLSEGQGDPVWLKNIIA
jgi:putative endonuclease